MVQAFLLLAAMMLLKRHDVCTSRWSVISQEAALCIVLLDVLDQHGEGGSLIPEAWNFLFKNGSQAGTELCS